MNDNITSAAPRHCQCAAQVISPFIISVDVSLSLSTRVTLQYCIVSFVSKTDVVQISWVIYHQVINSSCAPSVYQIQSD